MPKDQWLTIIGTASAAFDPVVELGTRLGKALDADEYKTLERLYYREATEAQQLLPGVDRYLRDAHRLGLRTAIASSSSRTWVVDHLERLQIRTNFDVIVCRDDVTATKPDPALYLVALDRLTTAADQAIALEDSSNGIRAAKAAGIFCVAVPNAMTAAMDLGLADLRLHSLDDLSLEQLLDRVSESGVAQQRAQQ